MAKQIIDIGTVAGDHTGTPLRLGGDMINDNFDELYAAEVLNTAKVTNANHTGDATGSGALTLATVNASPGKYNAATITVNAKGLVTTASSGTGSVINKYAGTVDLAEEVVTQKITTVTSEPYSILLIDASDNIVTSDLGIELTIVGGFYALNIYSSTAMNGVKIKILY
jgi:hypothetical protein